MLNFLLKTKLQSRGAKSNMLSHHCKQLKICGGDVAFLEKTKFSEIRNCFS